jgi:hypothetical protein
MAEPLPTLIPVDFYGIGAAVYFVSVLIAFAVSFFAFRAFRLTKFSQYFHLGLSFLLLSAGFAFLTYTSIYTYFYIPYFSGSGTSLNAVNSENFRAYYALSTFAYLILVYIYLPKKASKKFPLVYVPLWYSGFQTFHILALALLSFILIRNVWNFWRNKKKSSLPVIAAFAFISVYHLFLLLTAFSADNYIVAHSFLALGFLLLLATLIRVSRK